MLVRIVERRPGIEQASARCWARAAFDWKSFSIREDDDDDRVSTVQIENNLGEDLFYLGQHSVWPTPNPPPADEKHSKVLSQALLQIVREPSRNN